MVEQMATHTHTHTRRLSDLGKVRGERRADGNLPLPENDGVHFSAASSNSQIPLVPRSSPTNTGNAVTARHCINDLYTPHHCFCSLAGPGRVNKGISGSGGPGLPCCLAQCSASCSINHKNLVLYSLAELRSCVRGRACVCGRACVLGRVCVCVCVIRFT